MKTISFNVYKVSELDDAACTCAVASGYKGHYLSDVVIAVDSVMENYIKNGGDPYGVDNYMDKVFERLGDMGFDGQE